MHSPGRASAFILTALLGAMPGSRVYAQTPQVQTRASVKVAYAYAELPNAPGQQSVDPEAVGSVSGEVLDANGAGVEGALVTLESSLSKGEHTSTTDHTGSFRFAGVAPGAFRITVAAVGFAVWTSNELTLLPGQSYELPDVALRVASTKTDVDVVFTQHDLAEEQMKAEEKQRVLGVFPNFYVSYTWNAAPLSAGQKFRLALRTSVDPVSFAGAGVIAGVEQWRNDFSGYGLGAQGYGKRYGAAYADGSIATMIGGAILPSVLHQDPRYFYKGTGSISSRALYAISTIVICKGDNGHWQPNYSNVLGNLAAAGISNAYYPASNRNGAGLTIGNALIGTASGAIGALIQEFFIKKITRGIQP